MALYLNGLGAISPVTSLESAAGAGLPAPGGNCLRSIEPDYAQYIDPRQSRRMSRIVKMGIASARQALLDADLTNDVAGVIAGTGWGCLEDTVDFLQKLVVNEEDMLSPTAFIHSTHNTIAAQVAYQLKCRGYNSTYAHRNISFESALIDAQLLLAEATPGTTLLVGGLDELTDPSFTILSRLQKMKAPVQGEPSALYSDGNDGTWAGEGAAFFALSNTAGPRAYARLLAVRTISFSSAAEAARVARATLQAHGLAQADLLLAGYNGDFTNDTACREFEAGLGQPGAVRRFKHLCGEYPTASAFALGLAATLLRPADGAAASAAPRSILIYNRAQQDHQSVFLLTAC